MWKGGCVCTRARRGVLACGCCTGVVLERSSIGGPFENIWFVLNSWLLEAEMLGALDPPDWPLVLFYYIYSIIISLFIFVSVYWAQDARPNRAVDEDVSGNPEHSLSLALSDLWPWAATAASLCLQGLRLLTSAYSLWNGANGVCC